MTRRQDETPVALDDFSHTRLDPRSVRTAAVSAALSLPGSEGETFQKLLRFLVTPETAVEQLPFYFLPEWAQDQISDESLHEIAVAGKLVCAQIRWLDEQADTTSSSDSLSSLHRLNETLDGLILLKFNEALAGSSSTPVFFSSLTRLYARYAASLAVDGSRSPSILLKLDDYVEHAKARAAPVRAPVDTVLLLVGAPEEGARRALSSFGCWTAGLQLYDDALDIEEDFRDDRLSWLVSRTLRDMEPAGESAEKPGPDLFYEKALTGGAVIRNLEAAETQFDQAIELAGASFPNWIDYVRSVAERTRTLKEDLQTLVSNKT